MKIIDTENNNNKIRERKKKQRKLNEILKWIFNSQLVGEQERGKNTETECKSQRILNFGITI